MKPKAKTLIEKMGFVDTDMKNSDHDTIVEWIDENSDELISRFMEIDHEKNKITFNILSKRFPYISEHGTWEKPIMNERNYIIGFIDYYKGYNLKIIEYFDRNDQCRKKAKYNINCYFEAKTSIPSIGELMRQIQFYKTHINTSNNYVFIVSYPNPRAQRIVESQGFFWIDYPGDKPKLKGQRTLL